MMKLIALLLALASPAGAVCTQKTTGLQLCVPNFNDSGDVWGRDVKTAFDLTNSSATVSCSTCPATFGQIAVSTITGNIGGGGIRITSSIVSEVTISSSIEVSGRYKSNGVSGSVSSCSASQALLSMVVSSGIVTGGTCSSVGTGDAILASTQTFTGQNTFSTNNSSTAGESLQIKFGAGSFAGIRGTTESGVNGFVIDRNFGGFQAGGLMAGTAEGNVGIGTIIPGAKLEITQSDSATPGSSQFLRLGSFGIRPNTVSSVNTLIFDRNFGGYQHEPSMAFAANGNTGVGTSTPTVKFHVYGTASIQALVESGSTSTFSLKGTGANGTRQWDDITGGTGCGTTTNRCWKDSTGNQTIMYLSTGTHIDFDSVSAPTVSSCGSGPSITAGSTDAAGSVTIGASVTTSCVVTFASPYGTAPFCVASPNGGAGVITTVETTTTLTLASSVDIGTRIVKWFCVGK